MREAWLDRFHAVRIRLFRSTHLLAEKSGHARKSVAAPHPADISRGERRNTASHSRSLYPFEYARRHLVTRLIAQRNPVSRQRRLARDFLPNSPNQTPPRFSFNWRLYEANDPPRGGPVCLQRAGVLRKLEPHPTAIASASCGPRQDPQPPTGHETLFRLWAGRRFRFHSPVRIDSAALVCGHFRSFACLTDGICAEAGYALGDRLVVRSLGYVLGRGLCTRRQPWLTRAAPLEQAARSFEPRP